MNNKEKKTTAKKQDENDFISVPPNEKWLEGNHSKKIYDDAFHRIIDFYVLHSPCKVSSYSSISLESLGWENPWHSKSFRSAFDAFPNFIIDDNFRAKEAKKQFREAWNDYGIKDFSEIPNREYAIIVKAGETNSRMDLLHRIRNAFAHGRFLVKKKNRIDYVFLEDVDSVPGLPGLYVFARICIKKQTLLDWIDFFEIKNEKAKELFRLLNKKSAA